MNGAELWKRIKEDRANPTLSAQGMVKECDQHPNSIMFSSHGCDSWIPIPLDIIEDAEIVGRARCEDHTHPVVTITFKEPTHPDGLVFAYLYQQELIAKQPVVTGCTTQFCQDVCEQKGYNHYQTVTDKSCYPLGVGFHKCRCW